MKKIILLTCFAVFAICLIGCEKDKEVLVKKYKETRSIGYVSTIEDGNSETWMQSNTETLYIDGKIVYRVDCVVSIFCECGNEIKDKVCVLPENGLDYICRRCDKNHSYFFIKVHAINDGSVEHIPQKVIK